MFLRSTNKFFTKVTVTLWKKMLPSQIKALILDMDGVIWRADSPIGDLPSIFKRVGERGLKFVFATNNSTRTSEQYVEVLKGLGLDVEPCRWSPRRKVWRMPSRKGFCLGQRFS